MKKFFSQPGFLGNDGLPTGSQGPSPFSLINAIMQTKQTSAANLSGQNLQAQPSSSAPGTTGAGSVDAAFPASDVTKKNQGNPTSCTDKGAYDKKFTSRNNNAKADKSKPSPLAFSARPKRADTNLAAEDRYFDIPPEYFLPPQN